MDWLMTRGKSSGPNAVKFRHSSIRGFSLLELLTVVAIMSTLGGLLFSSLPGMFSSRASANGANLVANLLLSARQQAVSNGRPVAVVIANRIDPDERQAIILLDGNRQGSGMQWEALTSWQQLSKGVDVTPLTRNDAQSMYNSDQGELRQPPTALLNGHLVSDFFYLIYRPDGSIDAPQIAPSLAVRRQTHPTLNDYVVIAQENTGRVKVVAD